MLSSRCLLIPMLLVTAAAVAIPSARILLASLVTVLPLAAQEVVELPGEDRWLEPNFEELLPGGIPVG